MARADDEFLAEGVDVVGDRVQEAGVGLGIERAEGLKGVRGGEGRRRELFFGEQGVVRFEALVAGRVEAEGGFAVAGDWTAGDQGVSGKGHSVPPRRDGQGGCDKGM